MSKLFLAAAAVFVLALPATALIANALKQPALTVTHQSGEKVTLAQGKWLRTDDKSADLSLKEIGTVRIAPQSQVRLVSLKEHEQRLELQQGEIHARVVAPPRLFVVDTPATTAVDLGCEYVLRVTDRGETELNVISGAVALEGKGHPVFVPQGFKARTTRERRTTLPTRDGSTPLFREALAAIQASDINAVPQETLATLLREAKKWDSPTLFELLKRLPPQQQSAVAEQLAALIPPSAPGTLKRALQGEKTAFTQWWADIYDSYDLQ